MAGARQRRGPNWCDGGNGLGKYRSPTRCRGTWRTGGSLVSGDGRVVVGPIEGAETGDVGKELDVRLHGDRAVVPAIGTSIMLLAFGLPVAAFGAFALRPVPPRGEAQRS